MHKRFVNIDFSKRAGKVRPVFSANGAPYFNEPLGIDFSDEYRDLAVPYVRVEGDGTDANVGFVDIKTVFPDFNLDPRFALSYNFQSLDNTIKRIKDTGAEIYLCLGELPDRYGVFNKTNLEIKPEMCARICEGIISHYNEGFAGGFKYGIKYVELFSGMDAEAVADNDRSEIFYQIYTTVSSYLKNRFPKINIGAYSSGGFHSLNHAYSSEKSRYYITFLEGFLEYITNNNTKAPLDFLSWQCYCDGPEELALHANYARSYLNNSGFKKTKSIISKFNMSSAESGNAFMKSEHPAELCASLIVAEKSGVDIMFYSDMSPNSALNSLFSLEDRITKKHYASYEAVSAFAELYRLGTKLDVSEDYRREIYTIASCDGEKSAVMLATLEFAGVIEISLYNSRYKSYSIKGILGGGERGIGFVKTASGIPISNDKITLKTGKHEVYLISFDVEK